jgi:spore maturation protein CgeB
LACGIPLVSAAWDDSEGLFTVGEDFLMARTPGEMRTMLRSVLCDPSVAQSIVESGLHTINARHTCAHRVGELLHIVKQLGHRRALERADGQSSVLETGFTSEIPSAEMPRAAL